MIRKKDKKTESLNSLIELTEKAWQKINSDNTIAHADRAEKIFNKATESIENNQPFSDDDLESLFACLNDTLILQAEITCSLYKITAIIKEEIDSFKAIPSEIKKKIKSIYQFYKNIGMARDMHAAFFAGCYKVKYGDDTSYLDFLANKYRRNSAHA